MTWRGSDWSEPRVDRRSPPLAPRSGLNPWAYVAPHCTPPPSSGAGCSLSPPIPPLYYYNSLYFPLPLEFHSHFHSNNSLKFWLSRTKRRRDLSAVEPLSAYRFIRSICESDLRKKLETETQCKNYFNLYVHILWVPTHE